jgi:hypothetical protein
MFPPHDTLGANNTAVNVTSAITSNFTSPWDDFSFNMTTKLLLILVIFSLPLLLIMAVGIDNCSLGLRWVLARCCCRRFGFNVWKPDHLPLSTASPRYTMHHIEVPDDIDNMNSPPISPAHLFSISDDVGIDREDGQLNTIDDVRFPMRSDDDFKG